MDNIEIRVAVLEKLLPELEDKISLQLGRIISDIESEKGTRQRLNADWKQDVQNLQGRVSSLERSIAIAVGVISALQLIVPLVLKFIH